MKKTKHHNNYIIGKNALFEVLKKHPERLIKVYTSKKCVEDPLLKKIVDKGVQVEYVHQERLTQLVETDSHQLFIAQVTPKQLVNLKDFLNTYSKKETGLIVVLDSIFDPHNLGAIFRASECFGADLIVLSKNRGAKMTPTVSKTSVGASELVPLCIVSNLTESVKKMKECDFNVVSCELKPEAKTLFSYEFSKKTCLIFGSEHKGVQRLLSAQADTHLYIPMYGQIDSLNVSQAVSVFLYQYRKGGLGG